MSQHPEHEDLTLDGPEPDPPWPWGLRVGLAIVVGVGLAAIVFFAGLLVGDARSRPEPFDPIDWVNPVDIFVENDLGNYVVPRSKTMPELPAPALEFDINEPDEQFTAIADSEVTCTVQDACEDGLPVEGTRTWVRVDETGNEISRIDSTNFASVISPERFGQITTVIPLAVSESAQVVAHNEGSIVSAWFVETEVRPTYPGGVSSIWRTEIFHLVDVSDAALE